MREIVTVSQLNRAVAGLLERSFPLVWVSGEVSNLTRAASGHWYFSLKDSAASARAVMFRGRNQHVEFAPRDGDRVEVRAQVGLYEARGEFQLNVDTMRRAGAGDLHRQFLETRARLQAEGLLDAARKRPVPESPRVVGVVTSPAAAALRDVLVTLARRAPHLPVVLYPTAVQGAQAPGEIVAALRRAAERAECDVLLLVRGGGAIEDLWSFNDETVARAVAACPIPVICGVGHETDFTIADFVADLRAPTPTAAAAAAVPDRAELLGALARERDCLVRAWRRGIERREQRLDTASRLLRSPSLQWAQRDARLAQLAQRLSVAAGRAGSGATAQLAALAGRLRPPDVAARAARLAAEQRALGAAFRARHDAARGRLAQAATSLELVSPQAVLARGYAIARGPDGAVLRAASQVRPGVTVSVTLADGGFDARVLASGTTGTVGPATADDGRPDPEGGGAD
jgi:exodeoxyribonuclease VII large subunit